MNLATHLDAETAYRGASLSVRRLWPDWSGDLLPLKPLVAPLRATVFRITEAPVPAVVKIWGPGNADKAAAQTTRQCAVANLMNTGPYRASEVLAFDADLCSMVMQDAGTTTLADDLRDQPERLGWIALQSGQWLANYHSHSLRPHPFRPAGHKTWLLRLVEQCGDGTRTPPKADAFVAAATHLANETLDLRGLPSAKTITHRDLTLGNLIQGEDALFGIDFENAREDEPFRDLFSLALDLGQAGLPALAQGYGPQTADPKVAAFLCRAFALGLWANTPATPSKRQAARLKMAQALFDMKWAAG
ncbi:aminoglycoside phosphotransferase family protein [Pelagimonas varians]|uniref:Phosphotransferase enzyme family protein n=1 Tax=Pelagimonas varians TaxID=696760 RepID=A0A238JUX1_9RHOB|nr:aminoglycoside phosphotransferase family protein [Pelagimonas varians]PYG34466.1 phosphotransferase family enzyme [Pelagimonas varians]SMX33987.1 Phosphotransferase enzyme family protein [Pelagimonas varians]